jgi:hypothetical protein
MEHTTPATDTDALMAEVDALLQQADATDARVDALLDGWGPRLTRERPCAGSSARPGTPPG